MPTQAYKQKFNKNYFELAAWKENKLVCGIDEVGRGCLAGPVVVAAVVLFPNKLSRLIRDSKLMTIEERSKAYNWITKNSWHNSAFIHNRAIDLHNIYYATLMTMKRAYLQLMAHIPQKPRIILVDAMPLKLSNTMYADTDVFYFPFGERKSSSIAAASIIAKVTRDRIMTELYAQAVPGYDIASHKGYSTPAHKKHVRMLGPSIIHRKNYIDHIHTRDDLELQHSLEFDHTDSITTETLVEEQII
jgi:ribonuclease HII